MSTTRRTVLKGVAAAAAMSAAPGGLQAQAYATKRPPVSKRGFHSAILESFLEETARHIGDPELRWMFLNCYPNTLDTTVQQGTFEGKPDTFVITGDITAMWLRDSSAQVWPYVPLAKRDPALRTLLEGVIRRQTRCLLVDPYANAFMKDLNARNTEWGAKDDTTILPGVFERKYELDSLCYPVRLAYGYWKQTGDTAPFDARWKQAMVLVLKTMREQQRKENWGPYHFQRMNKRPSETLGQRGYGYPVNPVGLIASGFRPSDDACIFPFLVPSNLFAVTVLRYLTEMATDILHDTAMASEAKSLASEVEAALLKHAVAHTEHGPVWAFEVDGYGSQVLMDDANVPSLLALPFLDSSPAPMIYANTRALVWSKRNPWFFSGVAGEGIGGPHVAMDMIWPMSQIMYAATSKDEAEIKRMLTMIKRSSAGTGFIHESYHKDDPKNFTRPWFAWANTIFGELMVDLVRTRPHLLR